MKLPAFQFYPADWKKDPGIQCLTFHDRGVWLEILCLMHESDERGKLLVNGQPMPEDALARALGLDKQILTTTLTTLKTFGVASVCPETGALMSRRMVKDENLRKIRAEAGKQGGNPRLLNQNPTTGDKQKPTPSSSYSFSSSSSEERETPAPEIAEGATEIPDEKTAVEHAGMWAVLPDFATLAYRDWFGNGGRDANNVPKTWQAYVTKRWRYEQEEWRAGTHRGKKAVSPARIGPKQSEVIAYAKEKGDAHGSYAVQWFNFWSDPKRGWKKNGAAIDWKNEFQNAYAKHREKEAA